MRLRLEIDSRAALGAGAAIIVALAMPAVAEAARSPRGCVHPGERVVRQTSRAIIVSHPQSKDAGPAYFGCLRHRDKAFQLDFPGPFGGATHVYGPVGVWAGALTNGVIRLTDLRDGTHYQAGGDGSGTQLIRKVILTARGSVAYLNLLGDIATSVVYVCVMPSCYSSFRESRYAGLLDTGTIPGASFRVQRGTLRWTNAGQAKSVPFR
jgi:hypothetical protein